MERYRRERLILCSMTQDPATPSARSQSSEQALGLAIHTSTPHLGLALGCESSSLKQSVEELGRAMSNQLQTQLMDFIAPQAWTALDFLAVARGPGGFTGTRLGMVTMRTLAQQLDIPLYSISTLAAVAHRYWSEAQVSTEQAIALDMRAQRGQRFTALYQWEAGLPQAIIPDQVCLPEDWSQMLEEQAHQPHLITIEADAAQAIGSLWKMAQLRYHQGDRPHWETAQPFYGQHPVTL